MHQVIQFNYLEIKQGEREIEKENMLSYSYL